MKNPSKKHKSLYKTKWTETIIPVRHHKKCNHYFEFQEKQARCINCGMGLYGVYEIKEGKPVL